MVCVVISNIPVLVRGAACSPGAREAPPDSSGVRGAGCAGPLREPPRGAATATERGGSSMNLMAGAQVGLDDLLVALHLGGGAFGDLLAVVQHRDPVAQAHHQLDVVLDQQDRAPV